MPDYQPVSRKIYETLEELYLLKDRCNLTFIENAQKRTITDTPITDLYTEEDGEYLILEGGIRIRLDNLLAINGKPVRYFV